MKVKELINVVSFTKINIYIMIVIAIVFFISFYFICSMRYNMDIQYMQLKSRIDAHHVIEGIKDIVYEHCETVKNCNSMITNYLSVQENKQKVFNNILEDILYSLKTVDALCIILYNEKNNEKNNEKSKIYDNCFIVYAERLENDSIVVSNYFDLYQEAYLLPNNAPDKISLVGPCYWTIKEKDKKKQFIVLWQKLYDSSGNAIGAIYLDILCSNYFNYVTEIANNYNCEICFSSKHANKYIYATNNFDMIGTNIETNHWFANYVYNIFNKEEDSYYEDVNNHYTGGENEKIIYFTIFSVPNTNISINVAINFDVKNIENQNSQFRNWLLILFIIVYAILSFFIIMFGRHIENKYLNADVSLIEN